QQAFIMTLQPFFLTNDNAGAQNDFQRFIKILSRSFQETSLELSFTLQEMSLRFLDDLFNQVVSRFLLNAGYDLQRRGLGQNRQFDRRRHLGGLLDWRPDVGRSGLAGFARSQDDTQPQQNQSVEGLAQFLHSLFLYSLFLYPGNIHPPKQTSSFRHM